jgi:hypothetical protein
MTLISKGRICALLLVVHSFLILIPLLLLGIKGAAPLFSRRGVQMIFGVYEFLSNVNKSSVNVFITNMNSSVAETSTCTIKYFHEASVLYIFLTLDIKG